MSRMHAAITPSAVSRALARRKIGRCGGPQSGTMARLVARNGNR